MPVITTPTIVWDNTPLTLTAKVDAVINPTDLLLWESEFINPMMPDNWGSNFTVDFNGSDSEVVQGTQWVYDGKWRFIADSGVFNDANGRVELFLNDEATPFVTLTALNQSVDFLIPQGMQSRIHVRQPETTFVASIRLQHIEYFDSNGNLPNVIASGDQISVRYDYQPRKGTFSARAKVYDKNGTLVAISQDITLAISGDNSGGC